MNGLRRVSILLGVSLVLTLFLGGMTVLADEAGNVSGNSNPEPPVVEAPPETPGEPDGNGTPVTPAPAEPYLCGKDGIITGVNPEYIQGLLAQGTNQMKLVIPAVVGGVPVKGIGDNAFNQSNYASISFVGLDLSAATGLTAIGKGAFFNCTGLTGSLRLPAGITSVGENAFYSAGYRFIYLSGKNTVYGDSAFGGGALAAVVCPDKSSYDALTVKPPVDRAEKLTYPVTLRFVDEAGNEAAKARAALYRMPLKYVQKDNKSWTIKADYKLPEPSAGTSSNNWRWVFDKGSSTGVTPDSLVTGEVLMLTQPLDLPQVGFGGDIDKTYDGKPASLNVSASHPHYSSYQGAQDGDVIFYFIWTWVDESGKETRKSDYDLFNMEFRDAGSFTCRVTVQAAIKGENKIIYEDHHDFKVKIRKAEPDVTPVISSDSISVSGSLPTLSLKEGSTEGTIRWDDGQTIQEGKHDYSWTFTPKDSNNYTEAQGTITLEGVSDALYAIEVTVSGKGKVSPSGSFSLSKGETVDFTFMPEPGYKLDSVTFDGVDIKGELKENTYQLKNVPAGDSKTHRLAVSFVIMESEDMKKVFDSLPVLSEGSSVNTEQANAYLDAKIQYEELCQNRTPNIPEETLLKFHRSLLALPSIKIDVDETGIVTMSDYAALLYDMTAQEARELRNGAITNYTITINVKKSTVNPEQKKEIQSLLKDAVITSGSYDIKLYKIITKDSTTTTTALYETPKQLILSFPVPKDIKAVANGYQRTFYVAGLHENSRSRTSASLFTNSDSSGKTITIKCDKFSVFSVIYQDVKKAEDSHHSDNKDNNSSNNNDNNSSSNTYVPDYEKDFWDSVVKLIKKAKAGDTVNVNAVTYDKMPEAVMAALRENPYVALIVRWDGGKPVIIPAQTALVYEKGRVYYPLSLLSELYAKVNAALTTPAPVPSGSGSASNSNSGKSWEISAPSSNKTSSYTPTPKDKGSETTTETETESETETQETETPSETMEEPTPAPETTPEEELPVKELTKKSESKTITIVLIASCILLILVVVIIAVLLSIKRKNR